MYRGWSPSQGWRTFLTNHVDGIAAIDLFVLPTITFPLLYCLVVLRHGRRPWVSFGVTTNPTAEWISRQVSEAFPWDSAPRCLIRDRDTAYGPGLPAAFACHGHSRPADCPRSPRQNPHVGKPSHHSLSLTDFITNIAESDFRYTHLIPKRFIADQAVRVQHRLPRQAQSMSGYCDRSLVRRILQDPRSEMRGAPWPS
jgi:hypothetical protein